MYAGIDHIRNIFVVTFYDYTGGFVLDKDEIVTDRFSVLYELPTDTDPIEQIKKQAEAITQIYDKYQEALKKIEKLDKNDNQYFTEVKTVHAEMLQGCHLQYIPAEEINKDFTNLSLNKDIFFEAGDNRVKDIFNYTDNYYYWIF